MFKPANGIKKALVGDRTRNCAYVYRDGVIVIEERQCKSGKEHFTKDFSHAQAAEIPIYITHQPKWNDSMEARERGFKGRIVFHNSTLLLDGIQKIEIYYENCSESMKAIGQTCNTVTILTNSGMRISEDQFSFLASDMTLQNDKDMSILTQTDYTTIWHGDKPKTEEAA